MPPASGPGSRAGACGEGSPGCGGTVIDRELYGRRLPPPGRRYRQGTIKED